MFRATQQDELDLPRELIFCPGSVLMIMHPWESCSTVGEGVFEERHSPMASFQAGQLTVVLICTLNPSVSALPPTRHIVGAFERLITRFGPPVLVSPLQATTAACDCGGVRRWAIMWLCR